ncbi:MAG TPA: hypothetical protein PLD88_06355, partial [Candidatus Berkiella sp.]|nr:hypothetical protein [Candidatus Berkiella sp.]
MMTKFATLSRTTNVFTPNKTEELRHVFVLLMKEIIADAKYNNQPSSKLLLGFLLHHNFRLKVDNQTFNMLDIFLKELTPHDNLNNMSFISQDWQQRQG